MQKKRILNGIKSTLKSKLIKNNSVNKLIDEFLVKKLNKNCNLNIKVKIKPGLNLFSRSRWIFLWKNQVLCDGVKILIEATPVYDN